MKKILVINTGGTFNKVYNPLTGNLDIEPTGQALHDIAKHWLTELNIVNIIGKDSLDINNDDRETIVKTIKVHNKQTIIIVHGTDTIDVTADYLHRADLNKEIILTGAMVPYSINPIEATANFCSAYGYINATDKSGIYISMNGVIKEYTHVVKNREKGCFE